MSSSSSKQFINWNGPLGKMVDGWGRHQKWWWIGLVVVIFSWFAYDVGRLVTRADLLSGTQNIQGNVTIDEVIEKSEDHPGRLIVVSEDQARYIDVNGLAWNVPSFAKTATKSHMDQLKENGVLLDGTFKIDVRPVKTKPSDLLVATMSDLVIKLMFIAVYGLIFFFVMKYLRTNKGRFKKINPEMPLASIDDVAGYNGVKGELLEVVDYLKDPSRFEKVGARPPKGVLLYGPPGNGKTLLAKAVAGEAHAAFFEQSASSFMQIYAGEGAKAVRLLFEAARASAPSVIFIDEIDAVGGSRSANSAHDERIQTLNAILTEMDGFGNNTGIVVVAATNRLDTLDQALIRPGRFDRKVYIGLPTLKDRGEILLRHASRIRYDDSVNWQHWAIQAKGFSGADLAAFVNEAAIEAARRSSETVSNNDLVKARDRVLIGARNHGQILSDMERQIVAVHEMGHAWMRLHEEGRVEKVSISPRGQALGVTVAVAEEEKFLHLKEDVEKELRILLGGKAAEMAVFGRATAGAADDLNKASELARNACLFFGSEKWGSYVPSNDNKKDIEEEAAKMVNQSLAQTIDILKDRLVSLKHASKVLQDKEELNEKEIMDLWNK